MKGHTKIELTEVNSGNTKIIEEDNMVTAGLQKMLQPFPFSTTNFAAVKNIVGNALGGLLLFEDAIEESIENYMPPAGNKMIGRGVYNKTYTGEVVELGSFNVNESGIQDDGSIKFVWDFNTSQANGKISCVSLTSLLGGNLGLGDSVYKQQNTETLHQLYQLPNAFNGNKIALISYDENYYIEEKTINENCANDTGVLCFKKIRMPLSNVSIFDRNVYLNNTVASGSIIDASHNAEEMQFTLPQKVLDTLYKLGNTTKYRGGIARYSADGIIRYIFSDYASDLSANGTFYLCLLDVANNSIELKEIINKTGATLELDGVKSNNTTYIDINFAYTQRIAVTSQYIFCLGKKDDVWKLFRINIADNTDVIELDYTVTNSSLRDFNFYLITDEKIVFKDSAGGYIVDVQSCVVSKFDFFNAFSYMYLKYCLQVKGNRMLLFDYGYYKSPDNRFTLYPIPIHTINNLAEPVTKTSAHTMKVTYTLSEG